MLRVGLTGGLATGKSYVGQIFQELGCRLLKADELGHAALLPGGEAYDEVVREFGSGILDEGGQIQRRLLAAQVFGDAHRLEKLNSIIHPVVIGKQEAWFEQIGVEDPKAIAVVEAAILIETGSYRRFDRIVLTVCDSELQIERAMRRDGLSRKEVEDRLSRQMPLEEKRRHAHFVIDTSGDKTDTRHRTMTIHEQLRKLLS